VAVERVMRPGDIGVAALFGLAVSACASARPPMAHCADPVVVAYPPPPAQVEYPGPDREPPCMWMDGSWEWVGRRWQWKPGEWVMPPTGCARAAPITIWLPSESRGVLYYRPASFCPTAGATSDSSRSARCQNPKPCGGTKNAPAQVSSSTNAP
jgi:hypothetical protein